MAESEGMASEPTTSSRQTPTLLPRPPEKSARLILVGTYVEDKPTRIPCYTAANISSWLPRSDPPTSSFSPSLRSAASSVSSHYKDSSAVEAQEQDQYSHPTVRQKGIVFNAGPQDQGPEPVFGSLARDLEKGNSRRPSAQSPRTHCTQIAYTHEDTEEDECSREHTVWILVHADPHSLLRHKHPLTSSSRSTFRLSRPSWPHWSPFIAFWPHPCFSFFHPLRSLSNPGNLLGRRYVYF